MAMILSNAAGEGEKPVKTLERVVMLSSVSTGFSPSPAALLKIIAK